MDWIINDHKLEKTFKVKSFSEAAGIINDIAKIADEADHHPDVRIYGYNRLTFSLITHTEGKITEKDEALAKSIDLYFLHYKSTPDRD